MTNTTDAPLSFKATLQRRSPDARAKANPKNVKLAIAAFCYMCKGGDDEHPHLAKAAVRDCKSQNCQLWLHRGWQKITAGKSAATLPD